MVTRSDFVGATSSNSHIKQRVSQAIVCGIALLGLYLPTSIDGNIIDATKLAFAALSCLGLLALVWLNGVVSSYSVLASLLIITSLLFATLISPLANLAPGGIVAFIVLAILLSVDLRRVGTSSLVSLTYGVTNLINLIGGIGLMLNLAPIDRFFLGWYNDFYPDLLTNMIVWYDKPVLSFGSHSIAALFQFLFMYAAMRSYLSLRKPIYLLVSSVYLLMLWHLKSVTSLLLLLIAVVYCIHALRPRTTRELNRILILLPPLFVILAMMIMVNLNMLATEIQYGVGSIRDILTSPLNGFFGRFSTDGLLLNNLRFILNNWYRPAGLRIADGLFFGDSGPIEYLVRGSFLLLLSVYGGLYIFLTRNLRSRHSALFLFILFVAAEVGYTYLKYFRLVSFLPFLIVYLNGLPRPNSPIRRAM